MRISAKGRYAVSAMIKLAENYDSGQYITIISISEALGISKIYLEQVFSLLKKSNLVVSVKGAQGGYRLSKTAKEISAFDILSASDSSLFDKTENTVSNNDDAIENTMQNSLFTPLDMAVETFLKSITLYSLLDDLEQYRNNENLMFFI